MADVERACGAAMRRRQRRLRSMLRHGQQSVAMALAQGPPPQRWPEGESGGEARAAGGARDAQRSTEPDDTSPGEAAGTSV